MDSQSPVDWPTIDRVVATILETSWERPTTRLSAMKWKGSVAEQRAAILAELEDAKRQLHLQSKRVAQALEQVEQLEARLR